MYNYVKNISYKNKDNKKYQIAHYKRDAIVLKL